MDFQQLSGAAGTAAAQGRVRTAKALYEEALALFPEHTLFLGFNLGALLQMQIGDGVGARAAYERALAGRSQSAGLVRGSGLDELEANVCENSMLLSLSFEEYELWASRLEKLQPGNPILGVQRPRMIELRERGLGWWAAMLVIAKSGYDADPAKDPGRYAAAASVLQLLLLNRRQLRVPRDEHRFALRSYAALCAQAWSKCGISMVEAGLNEDPNEFNEVLEQAIPPLEEYAIANPSDDEIQKDLSLAREGLAAAAQHMSTLPRDRDAVQQSAQTISAARPARISWLSVTTWACILALAGYLLRDKLGPLWPWGVFGGALVLGVIAERLLSQWRARIEGPAPVWQVSTELVEACRRAGICGLRFELEYALIAPDQSLAIRFKPLDNVPAEKRNDAYMALRCVVALSLPAVAASTRAVELIGPSAEYEIDVGPGVRVFGSAIRRGEGMIGPLRTAGQIEGDAWWVGLEPFRADPAQHFTGAQGRVLKPLVKTFDRMTGQIVILPG